MLMVIYVIKYGDKHIFYSAACPQYLTVLIFFFLIKLWVRDINWNYFKKNIIKFLIYIINI